MVHDVVNNMQLGPRLTFVSSTFPNLSTR